LFIKDYLKFLTDRFITKHAEFQKKMDALRAINAGSYRIAQTFLHAKATKKRKKGGDFLNLFSVVANIEKEAGERTEKKLKKAPAASLERAEWEEWEIPQYYLIPTYDDFKVFWDQIEKAEGPIPEPKPEPTHPDNI
jgi:hypothetical protein